MQHTAMDFAIIYYIINKNNLEKEIKGQFITLHTFVFSLKQTLGNIDSS